MLQNQATTSPSESDEREASNLVNASMRTVSPTTNCAVGIKLVITTSPLRIVGLTSNPSYSSKDTDQDWPTANHSVGIDVALSRASTWKPSLTHCMLNVI